MAIFLGTFSLLQFVMSQTDLFLLGELFGSLLLLPLLVGGIVTGFHWLASGKPVPVFSMFAGFVTRPGALIAGGFELTIDVQNQQFVFNPTASADVYTPSPNTITPTGDLSAPRALTPTTSRSSPMARSRARPVH